MKSIQKSLYLALILILITTASLQAQVERVITLEVNTEEIRNPNVNDFCRFQGQAPDVSNEDYTVVANVGDVIIWRGISLSSPEDYVEIRAINHEGSRGGRDIFGQNRIDGENCEVRATVLNTTDEGADYKYKIQFRVFVDGSQKEGTFNIDPKIKVVGR